MVPHNSWRRDRVPVGSLLCELQWLAAVLDREPTVTEMSEMGAYSPQTYHRRFGSWERAKSVAGVSDEHSRRWINGDRYDYDPARWDPDEKPDDCQVCGTTLRGAGDGSTLGQYCPECEVSVWIA